MPTAAPSADRRRATAEPMPREPPVTRTTLPSKRRLSITLSVHRAFAQASTGTRSSGRSARRLRSTGLAANPDHPSRKFIQISLALLVADARRGIGHERLFRFVAHILKRQPLHRPQHPVNFAIDAVRAKAGGRAAG